MPAMARAKLTIFNQLMHNIEGPDSGNQMHVRVSRLSMPLTVCNSLFDAHW